jgi:mRNA-degrading endonuclease toxin of MazEF toxin-antitoxin module
MYTTEEYNQWNNLKKSFQEKKQLPLFQEREIWITSIGLNIGTEINGKQSLFVRPVLVLRKLNKYQFIGIPLTTKKQNGFATIAMNAVHFLSKESSCICTHIRTLSALRLQRRLGKIPEHLWKDVSKKSAEMLLSASGA